MLIAEVIYVKKYSISLSHGRTAEHHDKRDYIPQNAAEILQERNQVIYDCGTDYRSAFNAFFASSIEQYNAKQTRADRRKDLDYYNTLVTGKQKEKPIYEYVMQIGDRDTLGVMDAAFDAGHWRELKDAGQTQAANDYVLAHVNQSGDAAALRDVLAAEAAQLPERYPNFRFWSIQLHADEPGGTVHVHATFTPFVDAPNAKRGLTRRVSLRGACAAMGMATDADGYGITHWQNDVKQRMTDAMQAAGYDREYMGNDRPHLSVPVYKLQAQKEQLQREARAAEKARERAQKAQEAHAKQTVMKIRDETQKGVQELAEAKQDMLPMIKQLQSYRDMLPQPLDPSQTFGASAETYIKTLAALRGPSGGSLLDYTNEQIQAFAAAYKSHTAPRSQQRQGGARAAWDNVTAKIQAWKQKQEDDNELSK